MKRRITLLLALGLLVCAAAGIAYASSLQTVTRWWIGAGGGQATGGNVAISSVVGQPAAGSASGGSVSTCSGFWCGGQVVVPPPPFVFLPALTSKLAFYAPACSPSNNRCEENDTSGAAYGPLGPGVDYQAYPDDQNDYYYFQPSATFSLNVQVTGYSSEGQLIIYNSGLTSIGSDFNNAGGDGTMSVVLSGLAPGKYYVRVYTASGFSNSSLYTLRVSW